MLSINIPPGPLNAGWSQMIEMLTVAGFLAVIFAVLAVWLLTGSD
jgi:hypothetical protein